MHACLFDIVVSAAGVLPGPPQLSVYKSLKTSGAYLAAANWGRIHEAASYNANMIQAIDKASMGSKDCHS